MRGKMLPVDRIVVSRDELSLNQVESDDVPELNNVGVLDVNIPERIDEQPNASANQEVASDVIRVVGLRRTYEITGQRLYRRMEVPTVPTIGSIALPVYRDKL